MPSTPSPSRPRGLVALALALGTLALYAPVARLPFIHLDDPRYLTDNGMTQGGLTWAGLAWAFTTFHVGNWHPLTWLSHMLDVELFGLNPGAHHLVNAAFHSVNGALLFLALARLSGAAGRSLVVAALFAVHPLHVESVAWVAERKDVLSTFFGLLALLAYARHAEGPSARRMALVALALAASLLAKPMWVTLPFLLLLMDVWPLRRLGPPRLAGADRTGHEPAGVPSASIGSLVAEKWPLFAIAAGSSAVTIVAQQRWGAMGALDIGLAGRLGNAVVAYARYLAKTLWPTDLAIFYPHPVAGLSAAAVAVSALVLLAVSALAWVQWTHRPWLAVGWCWFLGSLVPVIGLVQVGSQAMADRYTYLPIVGIFIAVCWGAAELAATALGAWLPRAAAMTAVLALSALTWHQLGFWKDHASLLRHALVAGGESDFARAVLSEGLRRDGKLEEALLEAREAIRLESGSAKHWTNLGLSLRAVGQLDEARQALDQAVRLEPAFVQALTSLSEVELLLGHKTEAAEAAMQATRVAPHDATGWHRLAQVRGESGDLDGAIESDRQAVRLNPSYFAAWTGLAIALQSSGRIEEAGEAFAMLPRLEPGNFVGWRNLGVHLAKGGRLQEAERAFREASHLRPTDADVVHRLGQVQAALGDKVGAMQAAKILEQLDPARAADLRARVDSGR